MSALGLRSQSVNATHALNLSAGVSNANHFNLDRQLTPRETFKQNRSAGLTEWRQLAA